MTKYKKDTTFFVQKLNMAFLHTHGCESLTTLLIVKLDRQSSLGGGWRNKTAKMTLTITIKESVFFGINNLSFLEVTNRFLHILKAS